VKSSPHRCSIHARNIDSPHRPRIGLARGTTDHHGRATFDKLRADSTAGVRAITSIINPCGWKKHIFDWLYERLWPRIARQGTTLGVVSRRKRGSGTAENIIEYQQYRSLGSQSTSKPFPGVEYTRG